jgi:hypothetical protein
MFVLCACECDLLLCCRRSLGWFHVLQWTPTMGWFQPDGVLTGSEWWLQLLVPELVPRRRVQASRRPPQVPLLLLILCLAVGLHWTRYVTPLTFFVSWMFAFSWVHVLIKMNKTLSFLRNYFWGS